MKVVLAVDALTPPLTGIGRYTWELAQGLSKRDDIDDVRFYANGVCIKDPSTRLDATARSSRPLLGRTIDKWLRKQRAHLSLRTHLFHSPNYFLPAHVESGLLTVHDLSVFRFPQAHPLARIKQFEQQFSSSLTRCLHIVTDSEAIRREVATHFGWPLEQITAIPLGVSPAFRQHQEAELLPVLSSLGLRPGKYALCISTLEPRKRIDKLIDAYASLPAHVRKYYPLVIAGSGGWLSESIMARIEALSSQGWLRYLGFVDEAKLAALHAGARGFFFPSIYEGFGLPVIEAMASGVPVLATGNSVMAEVSNDAAWLTNPDDQDALRTGIAHVLLDDNWREEAIAKGLARAAGFKWDTCVSRTVDVYRRFYGPKSVGKVDFNTPQYEAMDV